METTENCIVTALVRFCRLIIIRVHQVSDYASFFLRLAQVIVLRHKIALAVLIGQTRLHIDSYKLSNVNVAVLDRM